MKKTKEIIDFTENHSKPININIENFIDNNGIDYATYVIEDRALVGEDGCKPVVRRVVYDMFKLGLKPNTKKVKASRVVGDTAGRFHPHGTSSVSGALMRLGQTFNMRIPLLDVQGELGSVAGSMPPADRYIDISLNKQAWELVREVQDNACDMKWTETGEEKEPVQLPVRWSPLLIQGTQGIAVGYASNIPPHNPDEITNACIANIKNEIKNPEDILKYIKGPDFPTGGEILGTDGIKDYLVTGSGKFTIRGRYNVDTLSRGRQAITFYELPYQVSPEQVLIAIDKAQEKGQLKEISEAKDLSDGKRGLHLTIYVKTGANINRVIEDIWKYTPAQSSYSANSTILFNRVPRRFVPMADMINQFTEFRKYCFTKKTRYKISVISKEIHRLSGLLTILVANVDKAIKIIRNSETSEVASTELQKAFQIDSEQAEYVLGMKLRQLTKADKDEIILKNKSLIEEKELLESILSDKELFNNEIIKELEETRKIILDKRRTVITNITTEQLAEQSKLGQKQDKLLSKNVECKLLLTNDNMLVKTLDNNISTPVKSVINTTSQANLFVLNRYGDVNMFSMDSILLDTNTPLETIKTDNKSFSNVIIESNDNIVGTLIVTNFGNVNITKNKLKEGSRLVVLLPGEEIIFSKSITNDEFNNNDLVILGETGLLTRFPISLVRSSGQGSGTIAGMKDSICVGAGIIENKYDYIVTLSKESIKVVESSDVPTKGRSVKGSLIHRPQTDKDKMIAMCIFNEETDILFVNENESIPLPPSSTRGGKGSKATYKTIFKGMKNYEQNDKK